MGYTRVTIKGVGWVGFIQLLVRGASFLKIGVAAFLLSPAEIGLYGLTLLTLSLVEIFTETGTHVFFLQQKRITKRIMGTLWMVTLIRGILLCGVLLVLSYPASLFFLQTSLFPLILLISCIPLVKSLENPYIFTLQRKLFFKKEFLYRSMYILSDVGISLMLLSIFHSVFALVLGLICSNILGVVSSWFFLKQRPNLLFHMKTFNRFRSFILTIAPLNSINFIVNQFDAIFIGRVLGASELGIYQVSQRISSQPLIELSDVFGKVTLPIYSKFRSDKKRLAHAYKRIVLTIGGLSIVSGFGILIFSRLFIDILGKVWEQGNMIIPVLTLYGIVMAIWGSIGSLSFSLISHHILLRLAIIRLFLTIPMILYFGSELGIFGVSLALLISILLIQPITYFYVSRMFRNL